MREACRPAARATATGAHESHSYWPPEWAYTSASPRTTAMALAPADPISTLTPPSRAVRNVAAAGGRDRDTMIRGGPTGGGGGGGGSAVDSTRPRAGSATAPETG